MASSEPARAIADVSAGVILATVTIAAPPERVFRAITEPGEIVRWWGSDELYRTTNHTADLRPGGAWRSEGKGSDGTPFSVEGEFTVVEPPHRLSMTWRPAWDGGNVTTVSYLLEPTEGGTRLTLRHEGFGTRESACRDHGTGWPRVLGWLGAYLGADAQSEKPKFFLTRLIPPRPDFPRTMSTEEAAAMEKHAAYCRGLLASGQAVVFGPVADPAGVWGLGVLRAADAAAALALTDADPVIRSGLGLRYEVVPMISAIV
jgi:uncharacterized protein YndB with AHSA1/START domain/uncharacterized protein YciI